MPAQLLKHSSGQLIAFGANMVTRKASKMVCWNNPLTESWEAVADQKGDVHAGFFTTGNHLPEPTIWSEDRTTGNVVCWQPGLAIEMIRAGNTWVCTMLIPAPREQTNYLRRNR